MNVIMIEMGLARFACNKRLDQVSLPAGGWAKWTTGLRNKVGEEEEEGSEEGLKCLPCLILVGWFCKSSWRVDSSPKKLRMREPKLICRLCRRGVVKEEDNSKERGGGGGKGFFEDRISPHSDRT
jgi:hypothetical protein